MKTKKNPTGIKHKIRDERNREERIAVAVTIAVLIIIISVSGLFINSLLNQPSTSQPANSTSEPKAAIVDQLSLTYPNQTFTHAATDTLKQAGYSVDYYPGEQVTVEFYKNLPTHGYGILILRVHSAAAILEGKEFKETPVSLFTSENYSRTKYVWEQLTDQLVIGSYSMPQPPYYFGITPKFVASGMNGKFQETTVIMMGCEGLNNTKMAEAFIENGAKVYISWNKSVLAAQTDQATAHLLQHFLIEKQTINEAVTETNTEVGPDPAYNSLLIYYPLEAGSYTIQNIVGNAVTNRVEIQQKTLTKKKINN